MSVDFRSLPAELGDPLIEAGRSYSKLSDSARDELSSHRRLGLQGKRTWGGQGSAAFRVGSGKILSGDKPGQMKVTPLLDSLAADVSGTEVVHGYGSVFDVGYILHDSFGPYVEYMNRSAFDSSLALPKLQMSLLRSHEGLGLATTLAGRMAVGTDDYGLGFVASLSLAETDAADLYHKLRTGSTANQTSIAGWIRESEWNEDYTEVEVRDWWLSRGEISAVHAGANPAGWVDIRGGNTKNKKKRELLLYGV